MLQDTSVRRGLLAGGWGRRLIFFSRIEGSRLVRLSCGAAGYVAPASEAKAAAAARLRRCAARGLFPTLHSMPDHCEKSGKVLCSVIHMMKAEGPGLSGAHVSPHGTGS